jgi:threonine dehydrogenase-like Zn-dependent dehydrogenase
MRHTGQAMETALSIVRPGSMAGYVGVPHGVELLVGEILFGNEGVRGGRDRAQAFGG